MTQSVGGTESIELERGAEGSYWVEHEMDEYGLTITIVEAIAELKDVPTIELVDDFTQYANPDALNKLFRTMPSGEHRHSAGHVHLEIEDVDVTVYATGEIKLEP